MLFLKRSNLLQAIFLAALLNSSLSLNHKSSKSTVLSSHLLLENDFKTLSYYIQGHQDDWELFYGHQLWEDLNGEGSEYRKVVFIYTTAGDAGSRSNGWWNYREKGAMAAVQAASPCTPIFSSILVSDHEIAKVTCGSTESYFMRLPDGSPPGFGYYDTGFASLKKLYEGVCWSVRTVDEVNIYKDWADFKDTLRTIMKLSAPKSIGEYIPMINVADYDQVLPSPKDHSDHHYTSIAIDEIVKEGGKYDRALYQTYCMANLERNLTDVQIANKKKLFGAYTQAASQSEHGISSSASNSEWEDWGEKNNNRFLYYN